MSRNIWNSMPWGRNGEKNNNTYIRKNNTYIKISLFPFCEFITNVKLAEKKDRYHNHLCVLQSPRLERKHTWWLAPEHDVFSRTATAGHSCSRCAFPIFRTSLPTARTQQLPQLRERHAGYIQHQHSHEYNTRHFYQYSIFRQCRWAPVSPRSLASFKMLSLTPFCLHGHCRVSYRDLCVSACTFDPLLSLYGTKPCCHSVDVLWSPPHPLKLWPASSHPELCWYKGAVRTNW